MLKTVQKLRPEHIRDIEYLMRIVFCDRIEQIESVPTLARAHLWEHWFEQGKSHRSVIELHFDLIVCVAEAGDQQFHFDDVAMRVSQTDAGLGVQVEIVFMNHMRAVHASGRDSSHKTNEVYVMDRAFDELSSARELHVLCERGTGTDS